MILKFQYNFFSMIYIKLTDKDSLTQEEIDCLKDQNKFELDCYDETIIDYELNRFNDEYSINPSDDTTRPAGGDYFKEIIFHTIGK